MKQFCQFLFAFLLVLFVSEQEASASHAMGADLTYNCIGPNQFRVRLSFYRDCAGITPLGSYNITVSSVSCGQNLNMTLTQLAGYPIEVSPLCPSQLSQSTCSGGTLPGVQQYVFEGNITLPMQCTDWVFSWYECCRNSAITTLSAPGGEGMTIWANLNNVAAPCNNSPDFTTLPVPYICNGQSYIYNHGAVDSDGDSLVYTLINAMNTGTTQVVYNAPYSGTNPMASVPAVTINSTNGNVTMNPNAIQVAVVTVRVDEYRNGVLIGSVMRDIQVTVMNCTNNPPTVSPVTSVAGAIQTGPFTLEVCPGTPISFTIPGTDPNNGQQFTMTWNNSIPGGTFTGGTATSPATVNGTFSWTPTVADIGLHSLIVQMTDNACPVMGSANVAITIDVLDRTYAGPDQAYCVSGGPVQLNATGGSVFNWTILSGSAGSLSCTNCASPLATPSVPTTYVVQSNLSGLCINRDTVVVTPVPSFALTMSPTQTLCQGGSGIISVTPSPAGSYSYNWSPSGTLSSSTISNPMATPPSSTTYTVTVTSAAGCVMTGSTTVNMTNYSLTAAPTSNPTQACAGAPITLNSNVTSNACETYTQSSIAAGLVGGGGWTNVALGDEVVSAAIPLGFNFTFFCNTYTDFYISSNGFISFSAGSGTGCCSGQLLPNAFTPNNLIALAWDDLNAGAANSVRYKVTGTSPNRRMVIHFNGVPHFGGGGGNVDGQIMLYETTNVIELHLASMTTDGTAHTEGIENATGTAAYFVAGRNANSTWNATNDAFRFTPVSPPATTVTWQAPFGNTIGTGPTLVTNPSATTTYYATVTDGVCTATGSVLVEYASVNAGPDQTICPNGNANLNAAYSGPPPPNNCNIYLVNSIPFAPASGSGTSVILGDDQVSTAVPLGFNFTFFCNTFSQVYISSNGFITFNAASASGCCSGSPVPTNLLTNFIAGSWNDLYPPGGGSITYYTLGTSPNRRFVVQYTNISHCCTAGPPDNTLQIILYETSNYIEIHSTNITDDGSTHTMGIGDATGTMGYAVTGRNGTNWTATNDAYRFSPQVIPLVWSWSPSTYLSSTNISNPTANTVAGNITYTVTVNNGTCVLTDQVTINTNCALAADLIHFTGRRNGAVSELNWQSATEDGLERYELERSADGQTFVRMASIEAVGIGSEYEHTDVNPNSGTNYYRLRMVDADGGFQYSNVVEVEFSAEGEGLAVYPNPASQQVTFEFAAGMGDAVTVEVFSLTGQVLYARKLLAEQSGSQKIELGLDDFANGYYLVKITTPAETARGRFEVLR